MHKHIEIFAALAAPFEAGEVRSRSQAGRDFQYVTARTVMNRLDDVVGPAGWWDEYQLLNDGSVMCRLSVELPDGSVVTKVDVGGMSETRDESDSEKSGFSDALKRAAVKFGVARYLYGDGVPHAIRAALVEARGGEPRRPSAALPAPAVAGGGHEAPAAENRRDERREPRGDNPGPPPKSGKALFAWLKERDERHRSDLLAVITDWGRDNRFPPRMVQWSAAEVDQAHSEALRLLTVSSEDARIGHNGRRGGR